MARNLRRARLPSLVLDVGAFDGKDALAYARSGGHTVWSFEPSPAKVEPIRERVRAAGLADKVSVFPIALSDANGTTSFHVHRAPQRATHFFRGGLGSAQDSINAAAPAANKGHVITVDKRRLGDVVPRDMEVLFAKIDAQGHELNVLQGASRLLANQSIKVIAVEWYPKGCRRGSATPFSSWSCCATSAMLVTPALSKVAKALPKGTRNFAATMYAHRLADDANSTYGYWDDLVCMLGSLSRVDDTSLYCWVLYRR